MLIKGKWHDVISYIFQVGKLLPSQNISLQKKKKNRELSLVCGYSKQCSSQEFFIEQGKKDGVGGGGGGGAIANYVTSYINFHSFFFLSCDHQSWFY